MYRLGSGRVGCGMVISKGSFNTKLQFCFGCTVELLVDRRVVAVESGVCSSTIGESLEDDGLTGRDSEEEPKLISSSVSGSNV